MSCPGFFLCCFLAAPGAAPAPADAPWAAAMRHVHKNFRGERGTFAQFGDSITVTLAFWTPLEQDGRNMSPAMEAARKRVAAFMKPDCWRQWKGPEYGSQGSMTIRWADENIDAWLKKLNPEVALIMFGTNDIGAVPLAEYEKKTRAVVKRCLENGTVVILMTIPPRSGRLDEARKYAEAAKRVAGELKVPLSDFFGECLKRRPDDWDGAAAKFKDYKDFDVPTLISRDGVHPSNPKAFARDWSEEALRSNGYALRSYLALLAYDEVIRSVCEQAR